MTKRHPPCLKSSWPLRAINGSHISSQLFLIAVWTGGVAFTFCGGAQNAAPADRNAVNTTTSVIFDMETIRHQPGAVGQEKAPIGSVELVEGKVGKACRFNFGTNNPSGFFTASVQPSPAWDQGAGLSFWVKGDGSTNWGGLELIDNSDYALRYGLATMTGTLAPVARTGATSCALRLIAFGVSRRGVPKYC